MKNVFSPQRINLKEHPEITEKVIQDKIADDPTIIGLGDLILKDKERIQPRAGRLDLLMQDSETNRRYEIELQLGKTDESHIIRTIEYWDIERKRYPQYDHYAVIIAEDITSRFLNIISLFNGCIPLIAIQLNAFKFGDEIGLVFTKVLDQMPLGLVDEDEAINEVTDREYWIKKSSADTVKMADQILNLINQIKPGHELKYNKFYIGTAKNGQPNNFASFKPRKNYTVLSIRLPKTPETDSFIDKSEIEEMDYEARWGQYRLRLSKDEIKKKEEFLKELLQKAESNYNE
jgi:hypothetical protein